MKKFSILSCAIVLVGFCACISCGYLISTAIFATNIFQTENVIFEKQEVYAISMAEAETAEKLQSQKLSLQSQNGAGFVLEKDEKFYLLASVYDNVNDAELVKNNLKNSGNEAQILRLQTNSIKIEGNFSSDEKSILSNALKANYATFKSLYDVAISLDTNVFDKTKAKLECNNIFSNHVSIKTNFETFFKDKNLSEELKNLQETLKTTDNHLSNLIGENYDSSTQTFSSLIKLTYCKILFANQI